MNRETFRSFDSYMKECMDDAAHDEEHIYRVLYTALDIAGFEKGVDTDILIMACLLHDIGRRAQYENPEVCHAAAGAEMAYDFCIGQGIDRESAERVRDCVSSHRFRGDNPPGSLEAKILFDADKLDVTGAMGIARTLLYQGIVGQPLYSLDQNGALLDGTGNEPHSFLKEYNFKLKRLYDKFHTKRGAELAAKRRESAERFYEAMLGELRGVYDSGRESLEKELEENA